MPPLYSPCYIGRWKNAWNCLFLTTIYVYYFYLHLSLSLSLLGMAPCRLTCTSVQTTWPKQNFCIIMAHAEFLVQGCQIYQRQWMHSDSWDSCRLRHPCEKKFMHIWLDRRNLGSCTPRANSRYMTIGSPTANTFWTAPSFGSDDMFTNFFSDRLIWTFDYLFKPRNNFSAYSNANSISLCTHASPSLISYHLTDNLCVLAPPNTCKPRGVALVKTFLGNQFIYDILHFPIFWKNKSGETPMPNSGFNLSCKSGETSRTTVFWAISS